MCSVDNLNINDLDAGEIMPIGASDLDIEENIINAFKTSLRDNRHYGLDVVASNVLGSQSSHAEISELFLVCSACPSMLKICWVTPTY